MSDRCYYCGLIARWICDFFGPDGFCERPVCEAHSVPEFVGGSRDAWTLCKDHAAEQRS